MYRQAAEEQIAFENSKKAVSPSAIPDRPGRILVVDDEEVNIHLLRSVLQQQQHEVHEASNGEQALRLVEKVQPDVILMDVMMPGMDGLEACRRLKSNPETCSIPIIVLTALNQEDDYIEAIDANADDFMTKPFKQASLQARVRGYLRLKRLDEEVERLRRLKEDLTRMIVHDLNGPMFGITGYLDLLLRESGLSESARDKAGKARRSATEASEMIRNLLQIDQMESGNMVLNNQKFKIAEIIEDAAHSIEPQFQMRQQQFEIKSRATMQVMADKDLVRRVVQNLLGNAAKFAPKNTLIEVECKATGADFLIAVENPGTVIPEAELQSVFNKFSQVGDRPQAARQGCGLGLAFCRLVAQAHNGRMQAISPRPGREDGARFEFIAPMRQSADNTR
ncbi:MAG: hybrid sensor histidine kinase/response regulator [Candidatus Sumerlaeota bacterium]